MTPAEILAVRARALAQPPAPAPASDAAWRVVEFSLGPERYGVEAARVREVVPLKDLTPVPSAPPFLPGIITVRGRIIAVLDLRRFFGLPDEGLQDLHRVIIAHAPDIELGILATEVTGVHSVPPADLQASLPTLTGRRERYLRGVTCAGLAVLDAHRLLTDEALTVNEAAI